MLLPSNPACVLVQMQASTLGDRPAYRRMARLDLGEVAVARIASVPQTVGALLSQVDPGAEDCVQLQVVHAGELVVRQGRRDVAIRAGSAAIYDVSRPFGFAYPTEFVTSIVQIPKRLLGFSPTRLAALAAAPLPLESAVGSVLQVLLAQAGRVAEQQDPAARDAVARSIVDAVALLTDARPQPHSIGDVHRAALREAARTHAQRHLADEDLGPATIARALHVSVRGLHAAFDGEPETLGRLVARLRFERAHELLLLEPQPPLERIARDSGHRSAAHLGRVLRERTGESPEGRRTASA